MGKNMWLRDRALLWFVHALTRHAKQPFYFTGISHPPLSSQEIRAGESSSARNHGTFSQAQYRSRGKQKRLKEFVVFSKLESSKYSMQKITVLQFLLLLWFSRHRFSGWAFSSVDLEVNDCNLLLCRPSMQMRKIIPSMSTSTVFKWSECVFFCPLKV